MQSLVHCLCQSVHLSWAHTMWFLLLVSLTQWDSSFTHIVVLLVSLQHLKVWFRMSEVLSDDGTPGLRGPKVLCIAVSWSHDFVDESIKIFCSLECWIRISTPEVWRAICYYSMTGLFLTDAHTIYNVTKKATFHERSESSVMRKLLHIIDCIRWGRIKWRELSGLWTIKLNIANLRMFPKLV